MKTFFASGGHYLIGLATIGALAALMAVGVVTAAVGVPVITGVASALIGGALGLAGTGTTAPAPAPAPVAPQGPPAGG